MKDAPVTAAISAEQTVNEVIRTHPATVGVFNRFGIDSCCGGATSIQQAAIRDGADPEALLNALNQAAADAS